MLILTDYLNSNAELNKAVRYDYCPLCESHVSRKGFIVTRTTKGFLMWCHSCHKKKFVPHGGGIMYPAYSECMRSGKKFLAKLRAMPEEQDIQNTVVVLPPDFTTEIPTAARLWLHKYGITQEEIKQFKFGYSPRYERLILPVYDEAGTLVYWQGRYFGTGNSPKYFNVRSTSRQEVWFDTISTGGDSNVIVLVEDIVSAIAVARSGVRAIALLGSYLMDSLTEYLVSLSSLSNDRQVCVWLDPDKRSSCAQFAKRLVSFGVKARAVLSSDRDPKEYNVEDIRRYCHVEDPYQDGLQSVEHHHQLL